jgi:hypothetical protein
VPTSILHLQSSVECLIRESCTSLPVRAQRRLVFFVIGILLAGTLVLRRIATTQAHVAADAHSAASHERRLRRLLRDEHLTWATTYSRVLRRVLRKPRSGPLRVLIDESGHTDVSRFLLAALWYRGRALPLAWVLWPANQPREQALWHDTASLLDAVASLLPAGLPVVVIADRAFGTPAFTDLVAHKRWDWLVRVQGQTKLRHDDGREQSLKSLLSEPGRCWTGSGQVFKKQGWRAAGVAAYWRVGCKEPLLVVSSLRRGAELVREYRRRSAIEAMFRDWKSSGWQYERSQVRDLEAHERLLVGLALATLLTLCVGEQRAEELLQRGQQQGRRRPWEARDSLFRLGRDELWARLWSGSTAPFTWELGRADAENWSFEYWRQQTGSDHLRVTGRVVRREKRQAV